MGEVIVVNGESALASFEFVLADFASSTLGFPHPIKLIDRDSILRH